MSSDNPYESPRAADEIDRPVVTSNVQEMLGLAKEDLWAYVSWILLAAGCYAPEGWMVAAAFVASTVCLVAFFVFSAPKFSQRSNMHAAVKFYGRVNNIVLVLLHVAVVSGRVFYLMVGKAGALAMDLCNSAPFS